MAVPHVPNISDLHSARLPAEERVDVCPVGRLNFGRRASLQSQRGAVFNLQAHAKRVSTVRSLSASAAGTKCLVAKDVQILQYTGCFLYRYLQYTGCFCENLKATRSKLHRRPAPCCPVPASCSACRRAARAVHLLPPADLRLLRRSIKRTMSVSGSWCGELCL